jgi:hypothetical protein
MAPVLPIVERVKMYVGTPTAAAVLKQISWRFVKLNAIFVLILDKSFGTFTYAKGQKLLSTSGQLGPKSLVPH